MLSRKQNLRAEMRMARWMCGVSLREKKTNAEAEGEYGH